MDAIDISFLSLPSDKEKQFKNKKIDDMNTLVRYTPMRYYNVAQQSTDIALLNDAYEGRVVEVVGELSDIEEDLYSHRVTVKISDKTGQITVTWFNQPYLAKRLHAGMTYSVVGKVQCFWGRASIPSPIFYSCDMRDFHRIIPQYTKITKMSQEYIQTCAYKSIEFIELAKGDMLTQDQCDALNVPNDIEYVSNIHFPRNHDDIQRAARRYVVENLYPFAVHMAYKQRYADVSSRFFITKTEKTKEFIRSLPFPLTDDQKNAVVKLLQMIKSGKSVDALVQGDVGCGKTIVAIILAVAMAENGYQTAIMAPTNVLAEQHFSEFSKYGLEPALLTGKMKAKEKKEMLQKVASGEASIIIGTHALIAESVTYKTLGMVIVDEEHRFGVSQREKLQEKAAELGMHKISMSATPIPRSLATAIYGKSTQLLDIHTMPAGRKAIVTSMCHHHKKLYAAMQREISRGHQCYMVCPFIEDSTGDKTHGVMSADSCYDLTVSALKAYPNIKIGKISGKMKASEIDEIIQQFVRNEIQILISTTIVEVGVNVPNATVMVIENAERFGLAQLHQLRGRVGRGNSQSYCVLMTESENKDNARLKIMLDTTDGFKIAEADALNRGIGDLSGEEQSGFTRIMELITAYPNLYKKIEAAVGDSPRTEKDWEELFKRVDGAVYLTRANYADVCGLRDDARVVVNSQNTNDKIAI